MRKSIFLIGVLFFAGCSIKNNLATNVSELAQRDGLIEVVGFKNSKSNEEASKIFGINKIVAPQDSDLDGVPDVKDNCPNTPLGLQVNPEGCPVLTTLYLHFDSGKANVKKLYYPELKKVADILEANPKLIVEIDGYTDDRGDESYNLVLSKKRAEAVKEVLVKEFNIVPIRIKTKGYGEKNPLVPNTTETNRALNRRVEIVALNDNFKEFKKSYKIKKYVAPKKKEIKNILNDSDLDGVLDNVDLCPNTPMNTKVNHEGCELLYLFNVDPQIEPSIDIISKKYKKEIEKIADMLNKKPNLKIEISGYTDDSGTQKFRLSFSKNVADSIKEVLVTKYHINPNRIITKGLGESFPKFPNISKENRMKNFRIEVSKL